MKDYTFSDGMRVPAGEVLAVPSGAIHMDPTIYEDPDMFDGFRFSKLRKKTGESFVSRRTYSGHNCRDSFQKAENLKWQGSF